LSIPELKLNELKTEIKLWLWATKENNRTIEIFERSTEMQEILSYRMFQTHMKIRMLKSTHQVYKTHTNLRQKLNCGYIKRKLQNVSYNRLLVYWVGPQNFYMARDLSLCVL
jgi:hypothetical protein